MRLLGCFFLFAFSLGRVVTAFAGDTNHEPVIVLVSGEYEYKSAESLQDFKQFLETHYPVKCIYLQRRPGAGVNDIPGLEALDSADLAILFIRRMTLPEEELARIRHFVDSGKPVIGIRTASHAFENWKEWDHDVLGGNYHFHASLTDLPDVRIIPGQETNPLLTGWPRDFAAGAGLYTNSPLPSDSVPLLVGTYGTNAPQPVAWTHSYKGARIFYTSLGHPRDFETDAFKRLLVNAIYRGLNQPVPGALPTLPLSHFSPEVQDYLKTFQSGGALTDNSSRPAPPAEYTSHFHMAPGLKMDVVASEPIIRKPLNLYFDERGRLWVTQYRQYPFPAGLKIVKYDKWLRAVYDKVPPPPPHQFKGKDRITILESTHGDGIFDKATDFQTDLNLARSVVCGRGGVWVLNPPYLLFYPDKNRADIPDGPSEVVLSGFGIEDTHSGANSLAWGPDGWLYGAHGSTCTFDIKGIKLYGQCIWRYQPETKQFEVFAEGGGNTYCLEFDEHGLVFSGSNGDKTRGFDYVQGGVYTKNPGKHGPWQNPYSFGCFAHMPHQGFMDRFAQSIIIYEGGAIPRFAGQLIAAMALCNRLQASKMIPDTSSWRTVDTEPVALTDDRWFRPVDTKVGPDGAIYMADWFDSRLSHLDPHDTWDHDHGRIERISAVGAKPAGIFDLGKLSTEQLIGCLTNSNKWFRQTALRLFYDRHDASAIPALRRLVERESGQLALEAFWALNASGGFTGEIAREALHHPNPYVRYWTIRLIGDSKEAAPDLREELTGLARSEPDPQVRSQLASTCKRLPAADAIPIIHELLQRPEDGDDVHIPMLLWWAIESKCAQDRELALELFRDKGLWNTPIVKHISRELHWDSDEKGPGHSTIISQLGERFTADRAEASLGAAAELLDMAPNDTALDELVRGMELGLRGDVVQSVPPSLRQGAARIWSRRPHTSILISFAARLGIPEAENAAIARLQDARAPVAERESVMAFLSEREVTNAVPAFLDVLKNEPNDALRLDALNSLQRFGGDAVGQSILQAYPSLPTQGRALARNILSRWPHWARTLLEEVDHGRIAREQISASDLTSIQTYHDPTSDELIRKHWGAVRKSPVEKQRQIEKVRRLLAKGKGNPAAGHQIFLKTCAVCHTLFNEGARIGPELTGYERDNLDFLLPAIIDPSLAVREEYTTFNLTTKDGQFITGFLKSEDPRSVTMMDVTGHKAVVAREQIQSLRASPLSLMPEGLLDTFTDQQIRDLISYVTQKTQSTAALAH